MKPVVIEGQYPMYFGEFLRFGAFILALMVGFVAFVVAFNPARREQLAPVLGALLMAFAFAFVMQRRVFQRTGDYVLDDAGVRYRPSPRFPEETAPWTDVVSFDDGARDAVRIRLRASVLRLPVAKESDRVAVLDALVAHGVPRA